MTYGLALIDKAKEMCGGSDYKLARAWGISQTMISLIRKGEKKLPVRRVPKLAELAGVDPREAMLRVAEEQAPEGSEARDLLGKALATGAVAMLLFSVGLVLLQPSKSYASEITGSHKTSVCTHRGIRTDLSDHRHGDCLKARKTRDSTVLPSHAPATRPRPQPRSGHARQDR